MRRTSHIPADEVQTLHKEALRLQKVGKYEEALIYLDKALEFEPISSELFYDKAISLQMLMKFDDAIRNYDQSLMIEPNNFGAYVNKGLCLSNPIMNKHEAALLCFEKALILIPSDLGVLSLKGYSFDSIGKYRDAIECFDKVLEMEPKEVSILINKGLSLSHLARYDEAIAYFDTALDYEPDNFFAIQLKQEAIKSMRRDFLR